MSRTIRFIALAAFVVFLTGCATTQQSSGGRYTLPETIAADDGILLVKLIGVQSLSPFNAKWRTLRLTNEAGVFYDIQDTAPGTASYSLFLGTLPKGQYKLSTLESIGTGPGLLFAALMSDVKDLEAHFGPLKIQPGVVTNLGTVVFALPESKNAPLKTAVLAGPSGLAAAIADVDARSRPKLEGRQSATWDSPPETKASLDALAIVRKHAVNLAPLYKARSGQVITGGALGMIHERAPDGKWQSTGIGSLDTITYVRELGDGRLFAGTDNGRYYLRKPDQQAWERFDLLERDVAVRQVERIGDAGYVIQIAPHGPAGAVVGMSKYSYLYKARLEDTGSEKVVLSFDEASAVGTAPMLYDGQDLVVYFNHMGISRRADLHRINPRTLEKRTEQVNYWVKDIYRVPDGTLVLDRMNGMSAFASFSKDNGKSWDHGETAGPHTVRFMSAKSGYGFSTSAMGWTTTTVAFNKTEDGGKSWSPVGTPAAASGRMNLVPLDPGSFVVFTGTKILSTRDEGQTWRTEWPMD
jgi:hypothetical protein